MTITLNQLTICSPTLSTSSFEAARGCKVSSPLLIVDAGPSRRMWPGVESARAVNRCLHDGTADRSGALKRSMAQDFGICADRYNRLHLQGLGILIPRTVLDIWV